MAFSSDKTIRFMLRKLYASVNSSCCGDNPDSPQHQEVLLPGSLYGMILKERMEEALNGIRAQIAQDVRQSNPTVDFFDDRYFLKAMSRVSFDIGAKMANFLATGNLISPTGLDLQQAAGFTIVAEKLNWYRYISHFRCIHRGAFFAELKTTTVRKLLPEAWGKWILKCHWRLLTKHTTRIPLPCTYSRWLALRFVKPFIAYMPNHHLFSPRRTYPVPSPIPWHDVRTNALREWEKLS